MLHNEKGQEHSVSAPLYNAEVYLAEQNLHACISPISCIIIKTPPRNCTCVLLPTGFSGVPRNLFQRKTSGWILAANLCGIA